MTYWSDRAGGAGPAFWEILLGRAVRRTEGSYCFCVSRSKFVLRIDFATRLPVGKYGKLLCRNHRLRCGWHLETTLSSTHSLLLDMNSSGYYARTAVARRLMIKSLATASTVILL